MTIAVAEALMDTFNKTNEERKQTLVRYMQRWGRKYPDAGYGGMFYEWLHSRKPHPYNSWGNGAAMRVSSVGWMYSSLEETRKIARLTASVTHNHSEGMKGAEAASAVIWAARNGWPKTKIRKFVEKEFYPLKETCNEIRPGYHFDVSC